LASELIRHDDFHSAALACQRPLLVYLPSGYRRDTRRLYPVLYLHDGQNIFDGSTSYVPGQYWRVKETADALIAQRRIEPVIIVAIYHGGDRRIYEYTPTKTRKLDGGGIARHARMMVAELRPFVRERYRVLPQARSTGVGGSSLGGLAALWLGLNHPEVYGRLAILSPSVWWDHRVILKLVQTIDHPHRQRVWLDVGTNEGHAAFSSARDVRLLKSLLVARGWREGRNLRFLEDEGGDHSEKAWALRVPGMLEWLFPRKRK
jgi:predicted alpha/beta superfamily hydrolase